MSMMGIWKDKVTPSRRPVISNDEKGQDVFYLNAEMSGIFLKEKKHGSMVEQGDLIGKIVNPLTGMLLSEVRAPGKGWLFTIREYPVVDEGSLLGRILQI